MAADLKLAVIVEAIDRFTAPMRRMGEAVAAPAQALGNHLGRALEPLTRLGQQAAGIGAAVGAGFELREIVREEDAFARLGIDAGIAAGRVEEVKAGIYDMAQKSGIEIDTLATAFRAMFDRAGIDAAEEATGALATTIQRLGGYGGEVGNLFGALEQFGGIKGPDQLLASMALLRAQIGPNSQFLADFSKAAPEIIMDYQQRFGTMGMATLRDMGALYGAIRPVAKMPREAASEVQAILSAIKNPETANALQGLGVNVLGRDRAEWSANYLSGQRRPMAEWMPEFIRAIRDQAVPGVMFDQILGPRMRDTLARMDPALVLKNLRAQGDVQAFEDEAQEAAKTLSSSLVSIGDALHAVGDAYATAPLKWIADTLKEYPRITSAAVLGIGSLAVLGTLAGWASSALPLLAGVGRGLRSAAALAGDFAIGIRAGIPALETFSLVLAANPVGAWVIGLSAAAAVLWEIYEHSDKIAALWRDMARMQAPEIPGDADAAPAPGQGYAADAFGNVFPVPQQNVTVTIRHENAPKGARMSVEASPGMTVRTQQGLMMSFP